MLGKNTLSKFILPCPAIRWHLFVLLVGASESLPVHAQQAPFTTTYDSQGRATQVGGLDGSTVRYLYDQQGARIDAQNPNGQITRYTQTVQRPTSAPGARPKGVTNTTPALSSVAASHPARTLPSVGLTVLTSTAVRASASNIGTYEFGLTDALDTPRVEQTFTLRNDSKAPLTLERMEPSCHCTTAVVQPPKGSTPSPAETALPTLGPGQQVSVHVAVNLAGDAPGRLTKSVAVYVKGDAWPAALLQVSGNLRPSLTFSPALLDFGPVKTTGERSLTLKAILDPRLVPGGVPPPLVSSNHAIHIISTPAIMSDPARPGSPKTLTATYTLTLRQAPMGPVTGTISFVPEERPGLPVAKPALPFPLISAALTSATALLSGQVTGDLTPSPQSLAFGPIPIGRETTRQVLLSAQTPDAAQKLRVESASRWLIGRLLDAGSAPMTGQAVTRVLQVTLSPQAPPGVLQSQLKIILSNGQRLIVPVSAYVIPTAQP